MSELFHVVPVDDLVEHDSFTDGKCVCGPDLVVDCEDEPWVWMWAHHSLDGREANE